MSNCPYCGGQGCPYCMPVETLTVNYYIYDEEIKDYRRCSKDDYENTDESHRLKTVT